MVIPKFMDALYGETGDVFNAESEHIDENSGGQVWFTTADMAMDLAIWTLN